LTFGNGVAKHPGKKIEVFATDEHRIGLIRRAFG
jgi:hypothetical protein